MTKKRRGKAGGDSDRIGGRERRIGTIVSQLLSRRGYASVGSEEQFGASVASAVGSQLGGSFRVGMVRRGVLQIFATDSVTMQEMTFQKQRILKRLRNDHPQAKITDVRFRLQTESTGSQLPASTTTPGSNQR